MYDVAAVETAHHVDYGVHFAYVRKEFVAQSLALGRAAHETRDIDELYGGGCVFFRIVYRSQHVEPFVRHGYHAHVGVYGAKRVIRGFCAGFGERVEQRGFAHVGQTYYA